MSFDVPFPHLLGCIVETMGEVTNSDSEGLASYLDSNIPDNWCAVIEDECNKHNINPDGVKGFIAMYYALGYSLCSDNCCDQATIPDPVIDNEHFNKRFNTIL